MPFNQNYGFGYAVTLFIQIFGVLIIGGIICLINTLFFAICWYIETFIRDLMDIIKEIDDVWCQEDKIYFSSKSDTFSLFKEFVIFNENIFR